MTSGRLLFEEEFSGEITLRFPPDKRVRVQVFEVEADDPDLLNFKGLPADEIIQMPEIGSWSHRTDITDSVAFIAELRRKRRERRQRRDY